MQFLLNLAIVIFLTIFFGTLIAIGASLCVKEMVFICGDQVDHCGCFFLINIFVLNVLYINVFSSENLSIFSNLWDNLLEGKGFGYF